MKTLLLLRRCGLFACAVASALCASAADARSAPASAVAKTHSLWIGADFSVEWEGKLRPVIGVEGSTFILEVDGRHVTVPSQRGSLNIKIDDNLKLSTRSADVTALKGERVYTRENDPRAKFSRAYATGAGASAASNAAAYNLQAAQLGAAANPNNPLGPEQVRAAEAAYQRTSFEGMSDLNSAGAHAARMGAELAEEQFDAFELSFDVASARPLTQPYVIIVTRYREIPGDPKSGRLWVYAEKLDPIGEQPRKVRLTRGGLPPGYELIDYRVHLYDAGQEIATSVARKRIALTADEAFQYSVVDYLGRHRDANIDPALARSFLPTDLRERLAPAARTTTAYLKIASDGSPRGAFGDPACTQPLDDTALASVLTDLRFYPALAKGKPCDGVAAVRLGELLR